MKSKYKIYLTDSIYAILTMSIEIPSRQKELAEVLGIGDQEQSNLIGQKMLEIQNLLGNTDEV